jgi:LacI family transcriptional regulator
MASLLDHAARAQQLTVLILSAHERRSGVEEIEGLTAQPLEGIISAAALTPQELRVTERGRTPLVFVNQFRAQPGHPTLSTDYVAGARLAVEHLITLGHRRIAFIGSASQLDPREAGWRQALVDAGLPGGPVLHSEWSVEDVYRAGQQLAERREEVTAVFAASDQIATGALAGLHSRGVDIPGDISVVGFDGTPDAAYTWPALTSVSQPVEEMTRDAVALLAAGDLTPMFRDYPATLLVRDSTAPPR